MCPELFHIGDFAVRAYGLAMALSFLIGLSLIRREARVLNLDPELLVNLGFVLIIFGAGKLPQIGDALGRSIKNFKKAADTGSELDVTPKKELGDSGKGTTDKVADKA